MVCSFHNNQVHLKHLHTLCKLNGLKVYSWSCFFHSGVFSHLFEQVAALQKPCERTNERTNELTNLWMDGWMDLYEFFTQIQINQHLQQNNNRVSQHIVVFLGYFVSLVLKQPVL